MLRALYWIVFKMWILIYSFSFELERATEWDDPEGDLWCLWGDRDVVYLFVITRWRSGTTSLSVPLRRRWWTWIRSFLWGRRAPVGSGAGSWFQPTRSQTSSGTGLKPWLGTGRTSWMGPGPRPVSYTHLTLPTNVSMCRSRWSPYH